MFIPHNLPNGRKAWTDTEVLDFVANLQRYDDRLSLVKVPEVGAWEIWYCPPDQKPHMVMQSKPGARLGPAVIEALHQHDMQRGKDPVEEMIRKNAAREQQLQAEAEEGVLVALDKMLTKSWRGRINSVIDELV